MVRMRARNVKLILPDASAKETGDPTRIAAQICLQAVTVIGHF